MNHLQISLAPQIIKVCLGLLSHDPNYNYDEEEDNDEEAMETDDTDEYVPSLFLSPLLLYSIVYCVSLSSILIS